MTRKTYSSVLKYYDVCLFMILIVLDSIHSFFTACVYLFALDFNLISLSNFFTCLLPCRSHLSHPFKSSDLTWAAQLVHSIDLEYRAIGVDYSDDYGYTITRLRMRCR